MTQEQCILVFGQCGCGKTTTINKLLGIDWNTCAYAVGTVLPHIKTYEASDDKTVEKVWEPYRNANERKVECALDCQDLYSGSLNLNRNVTDKIYWELTQEGESELKLANGVRKCAFIDLPGFAESIITDKVYYGIFGEFAKKATQILFISDGTCRAYREDKTCLDYISKYLPNLERFIIGLNKVDAIAMEKGQQAGQDPTQRQQGYIDQKIDCVLRDFSRIAPWANINRESIIPYSAISGWNFDTLKGQFFEQDSEKTVGEHV